MKLPRAILFDLDDTILVAFGPAQSQWQRTIAAFADRLGAIEATVIAAATQAASTEIVGRSSAAQMLAPAPRRRAPPYCRDRLYRARGGGPSGAARGCRGRLKCAD
jgi:hypothetical protein